MDEELASQTGGGQSNTSAVAILPTVRINGRQYRGALEAGAVLRALCAAFPAGREPPRVCNARWVSEDECAEGGEGWRACNNGCAAGVVRVSALALPRAPQISSSQHPNITSPPPSLVVPITTKSPPQHHHHLLQHREHAGPHALRQHVPRL